MTAIFNLEKPDSDDDEVGATTASIGAGEFL